MMDQFSNTEQKIEDEHYAYLRSLCGEEINNNMDYSTGQIYQSSAIVSGEGHDLSEEEDDSDSSEENEYNIPENDDTLSDSNYSEGIVVLMTTIAAILIISHILF